MNKFLFSMALFLTLSSDAEGTEPYDPVMDAPHDAIDDMYNSEEGYKLSLYELYKKRESVKARLMEEEKNKILKQKFDQKVDSIESILVDRCSSRTTQGEFLGLWIIFFRVQDPQLYKPKSTVTVTNSAALDASRESRGEPSFETYTRNGRDFRRLVDSNGIDIGVYDCIHSTVTDLLVYKPTTGVDGIYWDYSFSIYF